MSKLDHRTAVKNLSNLNVDAQYVYKLGLELFNDDGKNQEAFKYLAEQVGIICNELEESLTEIRKLVPKNLDTMQNNN